MDVVLFSGVAALCMVLAAMSSLIQAELRDRRRVPSHRGYSRPNPQARRPSWHGAARPRMKARARPRASSQAPPRHASLHTDPWAPFTVHPETSVADLKRQYRVLARRYHPDCGGDPRAMAHINLLYAELLKRVASG